MAFPILEGIQLFNAARGLISELRGNRSSAAYNPQAKTVEIPESAFAQLLRAQMQSQAAPRVAFVQKDATETGTQTSSTGPVRDRISALIAQFEAELAELREELGGAFATSLLDTSQELDLTLDADGNVTVANDHPDAETIEAVFMGRPMLRYAFARLASTASMIESGLDTFPAGLRYLGNPQDAVNEFGSLLTGANAPSQFHLVIGPEGIRTYFGSESTETAAGATTTT